MRSFLSVILFSICTLGLNAVFAAPVNINTADVATLSKSLKGIGKKKAANIVAYRTKYGPFKSVDDLAKVKGIGKKIIEKNRNDILLQQSKIKPGAITTRKAVRTP